MYLIELISCFSEKDNFETGCYGQMQDRTFDLSFRAGTKEEAIKQAAEFVGVDSLEYDSHNKSYYMDRTENADGLEPSKREMERFKNGDIDLWNVRYEFQLYRMELVTE